MVDNLYSVECSDKEPFSLISSYFWGRQSKNVVIFLHDRGKIPKHFGIKTLFGFNASALLSAAQLKV